MRLIEVLKKLPNIFNVSQQVGKPDMHAVALIGNIKQLLDIVNLLEL
jgi:hypothetical protein